MYRKAQVAGRRWRVAGGSRQENQYQLWVAGLSEPKSQETD
jgi:hypothetical protein